MTKKILLIEDEPLIQKSLKRLLEKKGAEVMAESTGREAIRLILNQNFDLIICDLMLQDISGFDIIEESKRKYSASEISQKFKIITAYCSPQVIEKTKHYNCMLEAKPFENIELTIEKFLSWEESCASC